MATFGPDGSFVSAGTCNLDVLGLKPGRGGYLSSWLCRYSAPNYSKDWSAQCPYGTAHYKEPLKSFEIRVDHSPGLGLPSFAILP